MTTPRSSPEPLSPLIQSNGAPNAGSVDSVQRPVTVRTLGRWRQQGVKFPCLTCYDATTARWLQQAGIPVLLAGDSAAEVILGFPSTIHAPMDFLVTITAAVKRGAPNCLVMADMPFMSYQADPGEAMKNAGRFMTEGMADAVKIEADRSLAPLVDRMSRAGIPVVAHVGFRPQQVRLHGAVIAGKSAAEAREVIADAVALEAAGAAAILLEASPSEVAERLVEKTGVPVIGCGAGPACHGQIVVLQDVLGLSARQPAFAQPVVNLGEALVQAVAKWAGDVRSGRMADHPYAMNPGEAERF